MDVEKEEEEKEEEEEEKEYYDDDKEESSLTGFFVDMLDFICDDCSVVHSVSVSAKDHAIKVEHTRWTCKAGKHLLAETLGNCMPMPLSYASWSLSPPVMPCMPRVIPGQMLALPWQPCVT